MFRHARFILFSRVLMFALLACILVGLGMFLMSAIKPCQWLDRLIQQSNCVSVLSPPDGQLSSIHRIVFSSNGTLIATTQTDDPARLWRAKDYNLAATLPVTLTDLKDSPDYFDLAFSPDSTLLAISALHRIQLWRVANNTLVWQQPISTTVTSVAFSHDGRWLATASYQDSIQLWDAQDGRLIRTILTANHITVAVAFSPTQPLLATGGGAGVYVWTIPDGTLSDTFQSDVKWPVFDIAFAPDGKTIASSSEQGLFIQNINDGAKVRTFSVPNYEDQGVKQIAFSSQGTLIAGTTAKGNLAIWRVSDGTIVWSPRFSAPVKDIAFSADGMLIALGLANGTVQVWSVASFQQ